VPPLRDKSPNPGASSKSYGASELIELYRKVAEAQSLTVSAPLEMSSGPSGRTLSLNRPQAIWAKLTTGGTSAHDFTQQIRQPGGSWVDGPITGTGNAYEVNSTSVPVNKVVRMQPGFAGQDWRFRYARGGAGAGHGDLTPCCPTPPLTLTLTSNDPTKNSGLYPNRTIVWGTRPCASLSLPDPGYYSTALPSPGFGIVQYYTITCSLSGAIQWRLVGGVPPGCAISASPRYDFSITGTCTPFFWSGGFLTGGDNTQVFTLSG
jgi:hypothetical protein